MPAGDDPDTFLKTHGVEAFRKLIADAKEFFDFKLGRAKAAGLLDSAAERTKVTSECSALLAAMSDPAARDHQINVVATYLGSGGTTLRQSIAKAQQQPKRENPGNTPAIVAVEATELHHIVRELCHLALTSADAQHFLAEQFETLHEADRWIQGIPLLERILAAAPDPASPASLNAFLGGLAAPDRLTLAQIMQTEGGKVAAIVSAEQTLGLLSAFVLQRRDAAVKAELRNPNLSSVRMVELLKEAKEISSLMSGMGQRSEFDDQLAEATWKPKEPAWKKKWDKDKK
jgi:DNA primase